MPTFEIVAPDGTKYHVEGPDGATEQDALAQVQAKHSGPKIGYAEDIVKSAGSGLAKGVAGLAGFPDALGRGIQYLEQKISGENDQQYAARLAERKKNALLPDVLPTTEQAQSAIEKVTGPLHEPQTLPGKFAGTAAEFVPGALLGPGGTARTIAGRVFQKATQYGIAPGLASEAAGQAAQGTSYEGAARIGGALAAPLGVAAGRRLITPLPATAERQAANTVLQGEGVQTTAGQRSGSKALQYLEAESGAPSVTAAERAKEQFTGALLRRAGENANRATPEVIDNAFTRIGGNFDRIAQNNTLTGDRRMVTDLARAWRDYTNLVPESMRAPVVENALQDITNGFRNQAGAMSGQEYGVLRSRLGALARRTQDNQLQDALYGIQRGLDNAMERSIARTNPGDLGALREARQQYRNLLPIAKAAEGAGEDTAAGLLSPQKMRQTTVSAHGGRNYARGTGDMAEVVRAGNQGMPSLPQSGTTPRYAAQAVLAAPGAVLGAGQGHEQGGAYGAGVGALAGALAGRYVGGRALMSRPVQGYLGNQALVRSPVTPLERLITGLPSTIANAPEPLRLTVRPQDAPSNQR